MPVELIAENQAFDNSIGVISSEPYQARAAMKLTRCLRTYFLDQIIVKNTDFQWQVLA